MFCHLAHCQQTHEPGIKGKGLRKLSGWVIKSNADLCFSKKIFFYQKLTIFANFFRWREGVKAEDFFSGG
jgi:hypothetical protein